MVIGVIVNPRIAYGQGVLMGVSRHLMQLSWQMIFQHVDEFEADSNAGAWKRMRPDGFVMQVAGPATTRLAHLGTPTVNVSTVLPGQLDVPTVSCDNQAIGRIAAEHLLEQPVSHFAYLDDPTRHYSRTRGKGYASALAKAGHRCSTLSTLVPREIVDWVRALPKPVGIMASNDTQAAGLLHSCLASGVDVRGQVAVVGVDNAWDICEATFPRLTSVAQPSERIGWEAVAMLAPMVRAATRGRRRLRPTDLLLPPESVAVRESSVLQPVDVELSEAMRLIRTEIRSIRGVGDLADRLAIGRRTLERRFKAIVGRSPLQEIISVRMALARQLLAETNLSVAQIAARCGFGSPTRLGLVMRELARMTPTQYRNAARNHS